MNILRKKFFTKQQETDIINAIKTAEKNTSGEIKVHVESKCKEDTFERALQVFEELGLHQTQARNGVLFYLATKDHKFAIVADEGINEVVADGFWDSIKDDMEGHFRAKAFTEGLVGGILAAGNALKANFPYQSDDTNELSDDISIGE